MPTPHTPHAPNAALLIDFDNVTLGIRSDLTKELRTLLNSDIIKGKVAVQRAYADWRRYPQYIVPLSESSIDLIFAPAFGTAKKNATDIRLAVDAIELVFTRPEIGTFILLSGDSDFSSMVLKLKEYGKYVIGVGMKESASDLLIQNCDEYYSYSDLAGLSKESEHTAPPRDPWELVVEAVDRMVESRDVMRSDRLKQVMQQIDPNFDERNVGMNRFSKFVAEAAHRGLISSTKQENGQFDVGPASGRPAPSKRPPASGTRSAAATTATPATTAPSIVPATADTAEGREERSGRRRRGRGGRGRGRSVEESGASVEMPSAVAPKATGLTLAEAFHLLGRALNELPTPVSHETLRARMAALHGQEDVLLDTDRFTKLLRQANDAEVADVRQVDPEHFEVSMHKADLALQMAPRRQHGATYASAAASDDPNAPKVSSPQAEAAARPGGVRFRGGAKSAPIRATTLPMVGFIELNPTPATAEVTPPKSAAVVAEPKAKPAVKSAKAAARAPKAKPAAKTAKVAGKVVEKTAKATPKVAATPKPAPKEKAAPKAKVATKAKAAPKTKAAKS